jgi:hypothetical protein
MTHAAMSVMSCRPPTPTTVWRSKGRFDLDTEFGRSAYRNTKSRRVSGLSIGYAIRNSTKTAADHELADMELIEVPIVAHGPMTVERSNLAPSARASAPACVRL